MRRPRPGPQHLISGRVSSGRPRRARGLGGRGVGSRGVDRGIEVNWGRLGQAEAQVRRLHPGAGSGAVTHQGVKLEVVVLRIGKHDVREGGLDSEGGGGRDGD